MNTELKAGVLVISLDFELMWGVRDSRTIADYGENITSVPGVIDALLQVFGEFGVAATFSTVGFLFARDKKHLMQHMPAILPTYADGKLSPYPDLQSAGNNETDDPFHYCHPSLMKIKSHQVHEIGTHTHSHYYCLAAGQTIEQFSCDLDAAISIASDEGIKLQSIVFPRNEVNPAYMSTCASKGINVYRGNHEKWMYDFSRRSSKSLRARIARFADQYIRVSGRRTFETGQMISGEMINVPASAFLQPYNPKTRLFEALRLQRLKSDLLHAAKNNRMFHLWWHPHNFGANLNQNIDFLRQLLHYYLELKQKYGMSSLTMTGLAEKIRGNE